MVEYVVGSDSLLLDRLVIPPAAAELLTGEVEPGVVADDCGLLPSDSECLAVLPRDKSALKPLPPGAELPAAAAAAAAAAPLFWFCCREAAADDSETAVPGTLCILERLEAEPECTEAAADPGSDQVGSARS